MSWRIPSRMENPIAAGPKPSLVCSAYVEPSPDDHFVTMHVVDAKTGGKSSSEQ